MFSPQYPRVIRAFFVVAALICIGLLIAYNEFLLARMSPNPPLSRTTITAIRQSQLSLGVMAVLMFVLATFVGRDAGIRTLLKLAQRTSIANAIFAGLILFVTVFILETLLRPITSNRLSKTTRIFVRDDYLGWRMRQGTTDNWGGVKVTVNSKGLRGPELDYARDDRRHRILYVGDSVTFGYGMEDHKTIYPYVIETGIEKELGVDLETVVGAVGGYSPWQYLRFLNSEGIKYEPDLVLVGIVLNDVTSKFELVQFGGSGIGRQLSESYYSSLEWLRANSGIYGLGKLLAVRIRLGRAPQARAVEQERLLVEDLVFSPHEARVEEAWAVTLQNLGKIVEYCRSHDIAVGFLIFPFAFQFDDPSALSSPQKVLREFAESTNVPCLDLLPLLAQRMKNDSLTVDDLFFDYNHLTKEGHALVARLTILFIERTPTFSEALGWR